MAGFEVGIHQGTHVASPIICAPSAAVVKTGLHGVQEKTWLYPVHLFSVYVIQSCMCTDTKKKKCN